MFVNTQTTEQWDRMAWKSYVLDFSVASVFDDVARQGATCRLSLKGKERQLIYPDGFALSLVFPVIAISGGHVSWTLSTEDSGIVKIVGAYFWLNDYPMIRATIQPYLVFPRDITLTDNQLQSLKAGKTECKLEFSGNETNK